MSEKEKPKKRKFTFNRIAPVFGSPLRPQILHKLNTGPSTTTKIVKSIPAAKRTTISYHIRELRNEGLIRPFRLDDVNVGYELTSNGREVTKFLAENIDNNNKRKDDEEEEE